ncbi:MAG: TonB-dependent receptor [Melioribacteraceae bacterium]|nr:TonB-dependent receptor [Melioribacteraceae bacterium]
MQNSLTRIFLIFFLCSTVLAQQNGTLRGLVTDSTSSEALAFGNAFIKELNIGASTDTRGYFLIPAVPANRNLTLIVSYIGYNTKQISIRLQPGKVTQYDIKLVQSSVQLQTIEMIGEKVIEPNETKISIERLSAKQLEQAPKGVETDVFRTIKYLPGVQSTGDVSARYYVRGGASNQNLILIDGIPIYNPFHALGMFGVIDPDMVNNIEFYKGGFSSEFGGRLSSVMKIISKDGNKNRFSGKATASFLTGKLLLEGPIPSGSFILTGRKSYSNQILKKFLNEQSVPIDFSDFSFKVNYANPDFIEGSKFTLNGFSSNDNILHSDPRIEDYNWSNNVLGFKWFQVGDSPLFYELGVSVSRFEGKIDPKLSNARETENKVNDVGLQMDFTYMFENKDEIGIGFHVRQIQTDLFIENARSIKSNLGASGANITLYAKYKLMQFDFVGLDIGTRLNLTNLSKNANTSFVEPRMNLNIRLFDWLALKGAVGVYQQELTTLTDENEVINIFEPWIISPDYLTPAKAIHYIGGLEFTPVSNFQFTVEGYYKDLKNLPFLNEKKISYSDFDFISGTGESYGLELFTQINPNPINFTASYTYALAYKVIDEKRYYPRYDVRHTLNLALEFNLGAGWTTNVVWVYNSGLPYTKLLGFYDKHYFDNIFAPWDEYDPRRPFSILGTQNLGRLPDYHRLDFTISKRFVIDPLALNFDFSIINIYDRKNIFYFRRDTGERVNMLPILPTATLKVEL